MAIGGRIDSFVATLDEMLRFLKAYENDLFYFDINPSEPQKAHGSSLSPASGRRRQRVIDEVHPGVNPPRMTPQAREKIRSAPPPIDAEQTFELQCGMNIHPKHGHGWPGIDDNLATIEWVRFPFLSSPAQFPSLEATFGFYDPVIDAYNEKGVKIILVMTHEMYGEGAGYIWPQMDSGRWATFTASFVTVAEKVIRRYGNRIQAYEIWNEGDAQPNNPAAVHIPPADYAPLLNGVSQVVRIHAPEASVVFGGLIRGPVFGVNYVKQVKAALGGRLPIDAIGLHPYGKGSPNDSTIFSRFGNIKDDVDIFTEAFPNVPLWFTEVGALGTDDPGYWDDAARFMKNLYAYLRNHHAERVPVVVWYAWSDAMDVAQKTNGLVNKTGDRKPYLYDTFFTEACK